MLAPRRSPSGRSCGAAPVDRARPARAPAVSSAGDPRLLLQRDAPPPAAAGPGRGHAAIDAAEAFRDLPGLVLLESARPGPQRPLDVPDRRSGRGPGVAGGRTGSVRRRTPARRPAGPDPLRRRPTRRRSSAVSSASSATTSGAMLERLPAIAAADQDLPPLRLHSTTGSSPGTAGPATPGSAAGRSMATRRRLARRLDDVHARLTMPAGRPRRDDPAPSGPSSRLSFGSRAGPRDLRGRRRRGSATTSPAATCTRRT